MALELGIRPDLFWASSIPEIQEQIQACTRRIENERREKLLLEFGIADAIASRIAFVFTDPKKRSESDILQPWERFPELFEKERDQIEKAIQHRRNKQELEEYKTSMSAFAERWNQRRANNA